MFDPGMEETLTHALGQVRALLDKQGMHPLTVIQPSKRLLQRNSVTPASGKLKQPATSKEEA
jgi:hypothetical protein